ncbi:MAG: hypothetical protein DWQ04_28240 [Chloroflexi bacterium]|nr:MAG: hypothetical protein DWQ04_28240 [Chloroflexota bacterium]
MTSEPKTAKEFIAEAFKKAKKAHKKRRGKDSLFVWGGKFTIEVDDKNISTLEKFLSAWAASNAPQFKWMMVEEVSEFYVARADIKTAMQQQAQIERVRLFGKGGDLDIRRDADTIYWRFISEKTKQLPSLPAIAQAEDFWADPKNAKKQFARHKQRYFQWRRDDKEQRVTHKWVHIDETVQELNYLKQVQYLENGRIAFTRYVDFVEEPA